MAAGATELRRIPEAKPAPFGIQLREQFAALRGTWAALGNAFIGSDAGASLLGFLDERSLAGATIFPPRPLRALELTPAEHTRVVVLGQDPYHGTGQAHGLAFSVPEGVALPPSLRNIYNELERDVGARPCGGGNLERWASQGVLLLNTVMTVEQDSPASHARRGWEAFTDSIVAALARDPRPKVFMLWGAHAQARRVLIDAPDARVPVHLVLQSNHPSPLSARRPPVPFVGCGHFSQANRFLQAHAQAPVDWCA
jgi:uracil-DNA glycosylase